MDVAVDALARSPTALAVKRRIRARVDRPASRTRVHGGGVLRVCRGVVAARPVQAKLTGRSPYAVGGCQDTLPWAAARGVVRRGADARASYAGWPATARWSSTRSRFR